MRDLAIPRASGPLSPWLVSSVAAVCLAATAPTWSGRGQWEPGLADAALLGATVILAFFLVAMVRLAVLDWLAERQSRRAWTAIAARAEEVAAAAVVEGPDQADHAYAPVAHDPAVWAIPRAHRHAVPLSPTEAVPKAGPLPCVQDALLPAARVAASRHAADNGSDDAVAAPSNAADSHDEIQWEARKGFRSVAPAVATIRRQLGPILTTQVRLVANAAWPSSARRVLGVPVKVVSDIIVTAQGKKEPPCGEPSPHPRPNGRTSAPLAARITGHAAPARSRLRRDLAKSLDPAAVAEARRQIVALAEALARQAAREDDAAENARERSRSPQDMPAEELPSQPAKDDTD
jgi:hypothetical protein